MTMYHQLGHHSENLVKELDGFSGAVLSPLNSSVDRMTALISQVERVEDFVFDPQLYFPETEREKLRDWEHFPSDVDTADQSNLQWWRAIGRSCAAAARSVGADSVASPLIVPAVFSEAFIAHTVQVAEECLAEADGLEVYQTVLVEMKRLTTLDYVMRVASIVTGTPCRSVYLVFVTETAPRLELRDSRELSGALRLVSELASAGLRILVGHSGPEGVMYAQAGARAWATGKFFNLRRFTPGRFDEPAGGGGQLPYWFEPGLMAYLREADVIRVMNAGLLSDRSSNNRFGESILRRFSENPGAAWLGDSWRLYMSLIAELDQSVAQEDGQPSEMLATAEDGWRQLESHGILLEEPRNDGSWVRPWRIALTGYRGDGWSMPVS